MILGLHERMVGLGPNVIGSKDRTIWTMMNIKSTFIFVFQSVFFKLKIDYFFLYFKLMFLVFSDLFDVLMSKIFF